MDLKGKKVAALVADGYEQVELTEPYKALEQAGATVHVVSPSTPRVRGWNHTQWGEDFVVDKSLDEARPDDYDGLLLPGGVMNPDRLRTIPKAVQFVRHFVETGKPIAAICHGPWTLIEAGAVKGLQMTSWPSLQTDLRNAGAQWVDREVVIDQGIVTSRKPDDIPAFNKKMIEEFAEGRHQQRRQAEAAGARELTGSRR